MCLHIILLNIDLGTVWVLCLIHGIVNDGVYFNGSIAELVAAPSLTIFNFLLFVL